MDKQFIESLGWKLLERGLTGYNQKLSNGNSIWVKCPPTCVYSFQKKIIRHVENSDICFFEGDGNRIHSVAFDKMKLVDYTALMKKLLKIKANPEFFTAAEYINTTKKLATLTR